MTGSAPLALRALRELLDGDESALWEVLGHALESLAEARAGIRNAMGSGDMRGLAFQAHRFKSSAGQLEATDCYRLCARLNEVVRREEPIDRVAADALVRELLPALDQLERDLIRSRALLPS